MNTRTKLTNYKIEPEVKAYLNDKLAAIEKLVTDDAARCEVEIGRTAGHSQQGRVWKAEIILTHFGERMCAVAEEESVKAALDVVKDEAVMLLKKSRGKKTTFSRRAGAQLKKFARRGDMRSY